MTLSPETPPSRPRPPEQVAIGMIRDAEAYRVAAMRVYPARAPLADQDLLAPAWNLLCHSSELALKAYLLSGGADPSAKKGGLMHSTLRHNLIGLYELAVARGFKPPDGDFGDLMEFLGPYHDAHAFRYRKEGRMPKIPPPFIVETLEPVIADIARSVRSRWMTAHGGARGAADLARVGLAHARSAADDAT